MTILDNCPHASFKTYCLASLLLEKGAHGTVPRACSRWHSIKRSPELVHIVRILIETWGRGYVNLSLISISWQQVPLNECLANVNVIAVHVVLSGESEDRAKPASVRHGTESVFEIAYTLLIFLVHVLALYY